VALRGAPNVPGKNVKARNRILWTDLTPKGWQWAQPLNCPGYGFGPIGPWPFDKALKYLNRLSDFVARQVKGSIEVEGQKRLKPALERVA